MSGEEGSPGMDLSVGLMGSSDKLEFFYQVDSARLCPSEPWTYIDSLLDLKTCTMQVPFPQVFSLLNEFL